MRKAKLFIASSLDGYIARTDGSVDLLFTDHDYGYAKFYASIDTIIMGRKTYDTALKFEKQPYKDKKSCVFTRRPPNQEFCNLEFTSNVVGVTRRLVHSANYKDIWLVGGAEINSILLEAGLIHEIIIAIHPTILGSGIPLFKGVRQADMKVIDLTKYDNGLLQVRYQLS